MSVIIRDACISDAPRLLEIYSYYVQHTAISFEYTTPTQEEFCRRMRHIMSRYPYLVAEVDGTVQGYAFCIFQQYVNHNIMTDIKTLYIDDLCVDEACRGQHIGTALYRHVLDFARASGCYNVTLNVWSLNESAMKFYQAQGLKPQKVGMEILL